MNSFIKSVGIGVATGIVLFLIYEGYKWYQSRKATAAASAASAPAAGAPATTARVRS